MIKSNNQSVGQPIYPLIVILEDAKKGYLKAAEKVKDQVLSLLFRNFGYQKIRYINELRQLIYRLGDGSEVDQFTLSLLHRACLQIRDSFRSQKKNNVIQSCINGEEMAIAKYSTAIEQIQQYDEVRSVLQQQVNGIKTVLNTIKEYTAKSYY